MCALAQIEHGNDGEQELTKIGSPIGPAELLYDSAETCVNSNFVVAFKSTLQACRMMSIRFRLQGLRWSCDRPGVEPLRPCLHFILTWLATFLGLEKVWLNKCCLLVPFHHFLVLERASTSLTTPLCFSRPRPPAKSDPTARDFGSRATAPLLHTRFTVLNTRFTTGQLSDNILLLKSSWNRGPTSLPS